MRKALAFSIAIISMLLVLSCNADGSIKKEDIRGTDQWLVCASKETKNIGTTRFSRQGDTSEFISYQNQEVWNRCLKHLPHDEQEAEKLKLLLFESVK